MTNHDLIETHFVEDDQEASVTEVRAVALTGISIFCFIAMLCSLVGWLLFDLCYQMFK